MKFQRLQRLVIFGSGGLLALAFVGLCAANAMPGTSFQGELPVPTDEVHALELRLKAHVDALATSIGERRVGHGDSLRRAQDYVTGALRNIDGVGGSRVRFEDLGAEGSGAQNVIFEIPGVSKELVVVGAHYDSAPTTPGANDNASGVAATLELARRFATGRHHRCLRFVLFANEEPPYFQNPGMGSLEHARASRERGDKVTAMLALESLGHYSNAPESQHYPGPLRLFFPDRGNFVGFVGNLSSHGLVRGAIRAFRRTTAFPSEGAVLPSRVPGVGWSDHWSFWQANYPAIMLTDTAIFRDPNYHEPTDIASELDYLSLARVTLGIEHVIDALAKPD